MPTRAPIFTTQSTKNTRVKAQQLSSRGSSAVYDTDWRKLRLQVLKEEPLCRDCWTTDSSVVVATMVHHNLSVHTRPDLRLDRDNLIPLCRKCHSLRHKDDPRET